MEAMVGELIERLARRSGTQLGFKGRAGALGSETWLFPELSRGVALAGSGAEKLRQKERRLQMDGADRHEHCICAIVNCQP